LELAEFLHEEVGETFFHGAVAGECGVWGTHGLRSLRSFRHVCPRGGELLRGGICFWACWVREFGVPGW
jgi:hypothetical protein